MSMSPPAEFAPDDAIDAEEAIALEETGGEPTKIQGRSTWQLAWARLRQGPGRDHLPRGHRADLPVAIFAPVFADPHRARRQRAVPHRPGSRPTACRRGRAGHSVGDRRPGSRHPGPHHAYGARISLFIGVVVTLLAVAVGAVLGLAAGYLGGIVDTVDRPHGRHRPVAAVPAVRDLAGLDRLPRRPGAAAHHLRDSRVQLGSGRRGS